MPLWSRLKKRLRTGILTKTELHYLNVIAGIVGVAASVVALIALGAYYSANQSFNQSFIECANWTFKNAILPFGTGEVFLLPQTIGITIHVVRNSPFSTPINVVLRYALHYHSANATNPILTTALIRIGNSSSFTVNGVDDKMVEFSFDIRDFVPRGQTDSTNMTLAYDESVGVYSAYTGTPLEVVQKSHDSRQINLFLPISSYSNIQNVTLRQLDRQYAYKSRVYAVADTIFGGILSAISLGENPLFGAITCYKNGNHDPWM